MRAAAVAQALAAESLPAVYRRQGYEVTITSYRSDETSVTVEGDVKLRGVSLPISWPVVVVNPPTLVPDPMGEVARERFHPVTGERIIDRFRNDPLAALVEVLTDVYRA